MKKFSFKKFYMKVMRQEGTPESVGRALFIGVWTGFVLPVGFQTFPALLLAFIFKANKALTWIATNISNPVSIIVIYPIQCYVGSLLIFKPFQLSTLKEKFGSVFRALQQDISWAEKGQAFLDLGLDILITFFVGGLFLGTILGLIGYWFGSRAVRLYRKHKEAKKALRQKTGEEK